jgi:Transglycosylase-like domain
LFLRRATPLAFLACMLILSCAHPPAPRVQIELNKRTNDLSIVTSALAPKSVVDRLEEERAQERLWNETAWVSAAVKNAAAVKAREVAPIAQGGGERSARSHENAPAAVASSISSLMACIKRAESGNYSEHSHTSDGSGAYQFIPSTWRAWSARAGYPGYQYAYLAPPAVQDAVAAHTLAHGGAHNWDPAYGNNHCTVGMP